MSIRNKVIGGLLAILLIFTAALGFQIFQLKQELAGLDQATVDVNRMIGTITPLNLLVKDVRFHVVQVQQWLTDISATRGRDGLDDGFTEAAGHRARFEARMADAKALAETLGEADLLASLQAVADAMPPFYDQGETMARAYIAGGAAEGNKLMGAFDRVAADMAGAVGALGTRIDGLAGDSADRMVTDINLVRTQAAALLTSFLTALAIATAMTVGVGYGLLHSVQSPIRQLLADLGVVAGRGSAQALTLDGGRRDEFGPVATSLRTLHHDLLEADRMTEHQKRAEEAGRQERRAALQHMASGFESKIGSVVTTVGEAADQLSQDAGTMSTAAETAGRESRSASSSADQAAGNVDTVAASAAELSSSIQEISRLVAQSSTIANAAVAEVRQTTTMVSGLTDSAQRVGDVVNMITDIAEQTNLLALNATIEAARAGDAGKGFAVVASEVKNLASQTARATDDIGQQIAGIQSSTEGAARAIGSISDTIGRISDITTSVAAAVEEQNAATAEIARSVEQASVGTRDVNQNMASVSTAIGETEGAARRVESASSQLAEQSRALRGSVDAFLAEVRRG